MDSFSTPCEIRVYEGWHNKVKKVTGKSHLNICEKVEVFKLQLKVSLRQLMAGGALRSVLLHKQTT